MIGCKTYLYDVYLDNKCVGNQGDGSFNTENDAIEDAKDFIHNDLLKEFKRPSKDFSIECYQAFC